MTKQQNSADEHRRAQKRSQSFADQARGEALEIQKRQTDREAGFAENALSFLKAEADTGLTLVPIAAESRDEEKRARNRLHARRAYDKLIEYRGRAAAAPREELETLDGDIAELREKLQSLGETFNS